MTLIHFHPKENVSPVSFKQLNSAMEKGKGKPHLESVTDTMAPGNRLAAAAIVLQLRELALFSGPPQTSL